MSSIIYHRQLSEQGFPVVVLHGLFGSLENLGVVSRELSKVYSVYALDLPHHGRSSHLGEVSLEAFADSIVDWMDQQQLEQAHFVGHSLGGKIAMEIALRHPQKVAKLLVADIAPVVYERRHDDVFSGFNAIDLRVLQSRAEADERMKPWVSEPSTRSFLLKNLEKKNDHWQWRMNLAGLREGYTRVIAANSQGIAPLQNEVLFIKGELSPYILPEHRESILSRFPKASVKVINNTQHWLHVEKPSIFNGIVLRFLSN